MAKTILVVEDDRNISELLELYLKKEGYDVVCAYDGGEAVTVFSQLQPDLVLLDLMLPVLDGWGVCRAIRQQGQTPVIMLTAKGELDDKVAGLKNGADDYITKPFEMREVLARVEAVLRRGAAPKRARYAAKSQGTLKGKRFFTASRKSPTSPTKSVTRAPSLSVMICSSFCHQSKSFSTSGSEGLRFVRPCNSQ